MELPNLVLDFSNLDNLQKNFFEKNLILKNFNIKKVDQRPGLLLHICCAPDLAWPLRWLKNYFKLYLFWYNPNIHPQIEHKKRYEQYIKLLGWEK